MPRASQLKFRSAQATRCKVAGYVLVVWVSLCLAGCAVELPGPGGEGQAVPPAGLVADATADLDITPPDVGDMPMDGSDASDVSDADMPDTGPVYTSCQALLDAGIATSGLYTLQIDGQKVRVYCDQTSAGGGWTQVATITNNQDTFDTGIWRANAANNLWESMSEPQIGMPDPNLNQDFRSPAFHLMSGTDLRITWGVEGGNSRFLLAAEDCIKDTSLAQQFAMLGWTCTANQQLPECSQVCGITDQNPRMGERVLLNEQMRSQLFLKGGEQDGADDSFRDFVYLSTDFRDILSREAGLGTACTGSCSGNAGGTDASLYDWVSNPAPGNQFWVIWVR